MMTALAEVQSLQNCTRVSNQGKEIKFLSDRTAWRGTNNNRPTCKSASEAVSQSTTWTESEVIKYSLWFPSSPVLRYTFGLQLPLVVCAAAHRFVARSIRIRLFGVVRRCCPKCCTGVSGMCCKPSLVFCTYLLPNIRL